MKRYPSIGWILGLLYTAATLFFGVLPHHHHAHHDGAGDEDCATCVWQAISTTDVPVVTVAAVEQHTLIPSRTSSVVFVVVEFEFYAPAAGRAPPETTA